MITPTIGKVGDGKAAYVATQRVEVWPFAAYLERLRKEVAFIGFNRNRITDRKVIDSMLWLAQFRAGRTNR
jgi:hypothetical protein